MTVKELIAMLLEEPMTSEVSLCIKDEHINGDVISSGYMFDIDSVENWGGICFIKFTDWRTKETEPKGESDD